MDTHVDAIRNLTREIPLNDFGLPVGIYRPDLLPFHDYKPYSKPSNVIDATDTAGTTGATGATDLVPKDVDGHAIIQAEYRIAGFPAGALQQAFVPLQYDEGFPALDTGLPFWSRLEFEPQEAFEAFQRYLQMNLGRPATRDEPEYDGIEAQGTRSLSALVGEQYGDQDLNRMAQLYQEYYHLYYWGLRAHAYDLFRVAQYRKQVELRAVETQSEHYHLSRRLRHRLMQYMDSEEEFWDLMSPKVAMDMLKTLTQLERISAGIPATGPALESASGAGSPFEVILKSVSNTHRRGGDERLINDQGEMLDMALEDEATTEVLQELVIRAGR